MGFKDLFGSAAEQDEPAKKAETSKPVDSGYDTPLGVGATAAEDIQRLMQLQAQRQKAKAGP